MADKYYNGGAGLRFNALILPRGKALPRFFFFFFQVLAFTLPITMIE
jgi:hypothetical protein